MRISTLSQEFASPLPLRAPAWATNRDPATSLADAALQAGAVFAALDALQRSRAPFLGVWRQRLALEAAANCCRLLRLRADPADLRDAWHLRRPGIDPGPAGRLYGAFIDAARRAPALDGDHLAAVVDGFGLGQEGQSLVASLLDRPGILPPSSPLSGSLALATRLAATLPRTEALALWCADQSLALRLDWPTPLPLYALNLFDPALRRGEDGHRVRPDHADWPIVATLGLAAAGARALHLAADLARRAARLEAIAPALRAKGADTIVHALLQQDALTAGTSVDAMSERALRRLFDRLVALGAVRELSGRTSFRLYGL